MTSKKWLEKIRKAVKVKDEWKKRFSVDTAYEYYEGNTKPPGVSDNEWININLFFSTLLAELPTLYSQDPYYYVKLSKSYTVHPMEIALMEAKGTARQAMVNYLKDEVNLKLKARVSILDTYFQFGVCKTHYYAEYEDNPKAREPITTSNGSNVLNDDGEPEYEPDRLLAWERYCVTRVHPDDFIVDFDADPTGYNWCAQRIKVTLEEAKQDERFRKKATKKLKATESTDEALKAREERQKGFGVSEKSAEPDTVVYWEIYQPKKKQWCIVSEGCEDEYLIKPEMLPPGIEGDPYSTLRFVLRDSSWYPIPPATQWIDSQFDYDDCRSKIKTHRKRFNRKYECYSPAFDDLDKALSDLENGGDGTIIAKNQPQQCVSPIQDAQLDQGHYMEINYLRQDFMDLAVGPNQRGGTAGVDSATEAGILEKRTALREGDRQSLVRDFLKDIGRKLDQLVQANLTTELAVRVIGVQGEFWSAISPQDYAEINGEFTHDIDPGSHTPQLPEIERAQWMAFLGLVAQAPFLAMSPGLMKKAAELHHISPEDPLLKEVAQLATQVMTGQLIPPGKGGSQAGVPGANPVTAVGGGMGANNLRGGIGVAPV